ncbi:hypothetical protein ACFZDK_49250 [Streptomyces sp. NPDC007901]|uniref:hypothetical protein n=1 Tax=Streptomyces sp. NPDC007901 TaxID=3364785 RepID=UPI0036DFAB3F
MSAATTERTAKERVRRTRSRGRNELAPLRVSELAVHEYDLDPACVSLVCPSCRTWVPINRPNGQPGRTRLVPHHTEKAGTAAPVSCKGGSHRRVIIDVEIEHWRQRLVEGTAETDGRRSNRVTRKPKVAVAPAVAQIQVALDQKDTLKALQTHLKACPTCTSGQSHCIEGDRLARFHVHQLRTTEEREEMIKRQEIEAEQREPGLRERQWELTADAVRGADIQRVHDALEMTLKQHSEKLNDWERADLASAITTLATKLEQLHRL